MSAAFSQILTEWGMARTALVTIVFADSGGWILGKKHWIHCKHLGLFHKCDYFECNFAKRDNKNISSKWNKFFEPISESSLIERIIRFSNPKSHFILRFKNCFKQIRECHNLVLSIYHIHFAKNIPDSMQPQVFRLRVLFASLHNQVPGQLEFSNGLFQRSGRNPRRRMFRVRLTHRLQQFSGLKFYRNFGNSCFFIWFILNIHLRFRKNFGKSRCYYFNVSCQLLYRIKW